MSELQTMNELEKALEKAKREAAKADGVLGQLRTRLKKEFDCSTVKQAKIYLKKLKESRTKVQREFGDELEAFEDRWGQL